MENFIFCAVFINSESASTLSNLIWRDFVEGNMPVKAKIAYFAALSSKKIIWSFAYRNVHGPPTPGNRSRSISISKSMSISGATDIKGFLSVKCRFISIPPWPPLLVLSEGCNFPLWPISWFGAFELHNTEEVQGELQLLLRTDDPLAGPVPCLYKWLLQKSSTLSYNLIFQSFLLSSYLHPKFYQT